jgi:tetratricopeptide (TPR) repeat protein
MHTRPRARSSILILFSSALALALPACATNPQPEVSSPTPKPDKPRLLSQKNEIPADKLDAVIQAHLQGLGYMERYEYQPATTAFRKVHELAPGWIPGSINLANALLSVSGNAAEEAKKAGAPSGADAGAGAGSSSNFDEALALLDDVVSREPQNLHAHYCRGLILEFLGRTADAHKDFLLVTERDPNDGHAWFKVGATLTDPTNPELPAGIEQATELIKLYSKALECEPYLVPALYKLQQVCGWARDRAKQAELTALWKQLNPRNNPAGPGDTGDEYYGESGKYARIINPFPLAKPLSPESPAPRFEAISAIEVKLGSEEHWAKAEDFTGPLAAIGRARARFGAAVVTFDADGDGRADLFLAAAVKGPRGLRDVLLLNEGDGRFEDVSKAWGLPDDRASLGAAAGDFDADRRIDVFLTSLSGYHLLRNEQGKKFADVTAQAGMDKVKALGVTARWLDLDQDGDLDLYVVNFTDLDHAAAAFGEKTVPPVVNAAFRNLGKPAPVASRPAETLAPVAAATPDLPATEGLSLAFSPWPDSEALIGSPARYTAVAALDIDDDRDVDLVVAVDGAVPFASLNDRLGKFHRIDLPDLAKRTAPDGLLVTDLDKDGRADLVATNAAGPTAAWRNATDTAKRPRKIAWEPWPLDASNWRSACATDLDLDTWPDLLGLPSRSGAPVVDWARNDGQRLANRPWAHGPGADGFARLTGFALADLLGDPLPEIVLIPDGAPPLLGHNQGNGRHWLALDLGGRWLAEGRKHMRTNPQGLGTRIALAGQGLLVTYNHTTPAAGLGQSVGPIVLGLGESAAADLVRLRWPDGIMQCELNQKADIKLALDEVNRKGSSCPVLFTWNGSRFVCVGDFLGGGGLGYLVAPGVYSQPDRDESVAISDEQLRAESGLFRLSITEPMDEVVYLDRLELVVVDRPPGTSVTPDERFAPQGPRPTGEVIAWTRTVEPERATDLNGRDVSTILRAADGRTADGFKRLSGWIGYAEEHGIVLDFGNRLASFAPKDPLVLMLAGWVEYPYSQTNYAAATAGITLRPPTIEKRNRDGTWTVIEPDAGYPAGLPRMTTLDLTGKLTGDRCAIRLRTNMECYWDQAFVALRDRTAEATLRQTKLSVSRAMLGHRGYSREVSADGRPPLLYQYEHIDPAPLALMAGQLTRHGDVRALLLDDDDQLCVAGPGDEVRLEFGARGLPELPEGWSRSYVLKAVGYCKDADPFTAMSDQVEPLPWRAMPPFPFAQDVHRPDDPRYRAYLEEYHTRTAGTR